MRALFCGKAFLWPNNGVDRSKLIPSRAMGIVDVERHTTGHTTEGCQWGDTKVGWSPAARRGSLNWPGRGPRRRRLRREARRCVLRDNSWHDAGGAQAGPGGSCSFLSLRCRGHGMGWMGDGRWPVGRDHGTVSRPHIVTWAVPGGPSEFSFLHSPSPAALLARDALGRPPPYHRRHAPPPSPLSSRAALTLALAMEPAVASKGEGQAHGAPHPFGGGARRWAWRLPLLAPDDPVLFSTSSLLRTPAALCLRGRGPVYPAGRQQQSVSRCARCEGSHEWHTYLRKMHGVIV